MGTTKHNDQILTISEHIDINSDDALTPHEQLGVLDHVLRNEVFASPEVQAVIAVDLDGFETVRLVGPPAAVREALDLLAEY